MGSCCPSFLPPGSEHTAQGVSAAWAHVSPALSHHPPANVGPTSTVSEPEGQAPQLRKQKPQELLESGNADIPRPCPSPSLKDLPWDLYTLSGATPCLFGPGFTTPALKGLQERVGREGEKEQEQRREEREREGEGGGEVPRSKGSLVQDRECTNTWDPEISHPPVKGRERWAKRRWESR